MKHLQIIGLSALLISAALPVYAHEAETADNMKMEGTAAEGMLGIHEMKAEITAVDKTTGFVDVDSGGLKQHLHFPPASIAELKVGDTITLHLSYTK